QEYSPEEKKLVGPVKNIFKGTSRGCTEGPHLYQYQGYYYLMVAEGGTGYPHCVTMARSKELLGEYEVDPENPMLTSVDDETNPLQKAGHASLVQTQNGEWYLAHLCSRPLKERRCVLGRESAIQEVYWNEDGWLRLKHGGHNPALTVSEPDLPEYPFEPEPVRDDFNSEELNIQFQTLRIPLGEEWVSIKERKGYLRLYGAEAFTSCFRQTLVARRQQAFCYRAQTCVEFEPERYQQMAGLVTIYDNENYYYLRITDTDGRKTLGVLYNINGEISFPGQEVDITGVKRVHLRIEVKEEQMRFYYACEEEKGFLPIGEQYDITTLSDECCREGCFTGTFVGICCQDTSGCRKYADFDYFEYREDL
ncbi:MAG: glycoside hydrolase family 43 protein, partial [Lachnospiraceae bacterium]|nr:glycoside hydrolase family 43 protein [Lachnospiraceae bacterium]